LAEPAADAAARLLAHEMAPHAPQPGEKVLQLRELHLDPALVRGRMRAEDVEDERGAVDDLDGLPHYLLEVRLLRGSELVIEDHHVRVEVAHVRHELLGLALSDEGARDGLVQSLRHGHDDVGAVGLGKPSELCHGVLDGPVGVAEVDSDENGALGDGRRRPWGKPSQSSSPSLERTRRSCLRHPRWRPGRGRSTGRDHHGETTRADALRSVACAA